MIRRRAARRLALAAAASVVALAGPTATAASGLAPEELTLRLSDLPGGYHAPRDELGDVCSVFTGMTSPSRQLSELLRRLDPSSCTVSAQRSWPAPDAPHAPSDVSSTAFVLADSAQADALLGLPRQLTAMITGESRDVFTVEDPPPAIGDEAVLARADAGLAAVVLWRSGPVLGVVVTASRRTGDANAEAAVRLAMLQQARIAAPMPVTQADYDDLEIALDDPRLDVPVAWLGRTLAPHGRLRALRLLEARPPAPDDAREGIRPTMSYGRKSTLYATVTLTLLHPSALRSRATRRELRRIARDRCTRRMRFTLARGHATIWMPVPNCDDDVPDDPVALAVLPGVAVAISGGRCRECNRPVTRYYTAAGLRRIARALVIR